LRVVDENEKLQSSLEQWKREPLVDSYIEAVKSELKRVSKGEPDTWGFVAMFFDILDKTKSTFTSLNKEAGSEKGEKI
jgi:hypothetical protein